MNQLYHVEGTVNRGFVGQITYTISLDHPCDKLDIHFTFDADKRKYREEEATPEFIRETREASFRNYGYKISNAKARWVILKAMKTEIHTLATLNDEFIGCIHKQLPDRHMLYKGNYASMGCIPQERFEGVLKVTVLVFNVIKDNTHYTLTVSGE